MAEQREIRNGIDHRFTYNDGRSWRVARGRSAATGEVVDRWKTVHPIVRGRPTAAEFVREFRRELKIRKYAKSTIKQYAYAVSKFLRWFNNPPHQVHRDVVRGWLETLVDGGASSAQLVLHLSAIRTAFDKFCGRGVTLGLETPRRPIRLPTVLSRSEVRRCLCAATGVRDRLLISLLYATGMRVSEVARLQWAHVNFDRRLLQVVDGKCGKDRVVDLPGSLIALLRQMCQLRKGSVYVFPSCHRPDSKHISPRTIQRVVERVARLAEIKRRITPHTFRHTYATHLLEDGTDIRFIQRMLGHVKLETTRLYTHVAKFKAAGVQNPLDRLQLGPRVEASVDRPVGSFRIELTKLNENRAAAVLMISAGAREARIEGIRVQSVGAGWTEIELPNQEEWQQQMAGFSSEVLGRLESVDFYEAIRREIQRQFAALIAMD